MRCVARAPAFRTAPQHVLMYDSVGMDRSVAKKISHPTFVAPQNRLMPRLESSVCISFALSFMADAQTHWRVRRTPTPFI